jgi:hypothetical protein
VKKSKRMSWLGNAAFVEEMRIPYISVGKPERHKRLDPLFTTYET